MLPGEVCEGNSIATNFSNARLRYPHHQMIGHLLKGELFEKRLQKFFKEIGFEYTNSTATEALVEYLKTQNYPTDSVEYKINGAETVWVIIPKPYKEPKGQKFVNLFKGLSTPEFMRGKNQDLELTVYMTPITREVKEITFRVDIPDYIYNKCMEDPVVEDRPGLKYIESNVLSVLHTKIKDLDSQALNLVERERASEKYTKKIAVIFSSAENGQRDSFNHAYMGQKITTTFQWYTVYQFTDGWGRKNYFSWKRMHSKNLSGLAEFPDINGIIDYEKQGRKNHFHTSPPGILIDWTQEREDFLTALEEKFRQLSGNLNQFLSDLNSEKLDHLIATSALKLLGTSK
jgi:hypothetical protein